MKESKVLEKGVEAKKDESKDDKKDTEEKPVEIAKNKDKKNDDAPKKAEEPSIPVGKENGAKADEKKSESDDKKASDIDKKDSPNTITEKCVKEKDAKKPETENVAAKAPS